MNFENDGIVELNDVPDHDFTTPIKKKNKVKKIKRGILIALMIALVVLLIWYVFEAKFLIHIDDAENVYDGFGRMLYRAPFVLRFVMDTYPGWLYTFLDWGICFVLFVIICGIWECIKKIK